MNNINGQNKNLFGNLNATEEEVYNALIELGWILPRNEEDFQRAEKAFEGTECPPLSSELKDPTSLIERLRKEQETESTQNNKDLAPERSKLQGNIALDLAPTLLSLLRQATKISQSLIAQRLEVTIPFMRGCSDFHDSVPEQCKQELIERTFREFNFIDKSLIEKVVRHPGQVATAGFRDSSYSGKRMNFEEIVEKSGMDDVYKKFWLDLAIGEKQ